MEFSKKTAPYAGVFWMFVTGVLFVGVTVLVKINGTRIPAAEAAFLRYILGFAFLIPMLLKTRITRNSARLWGLFTIRGFAHTCGIIGWFYAMANISIAEVTALSYLSPIFVTLGAAVFLGEELALRRILAVMTALLGSLIILRPGFRTLDPAHYGMMVTAVFFAVSYLLGKYLSEDNSPALLVIMLSFFVSIGLAPVAWSVWIPPTLNEVVILGGVALLATTGHYTMTLAFSAAPITVTQPVSFLQLVWAVLIGALFFGEGFDFWVVLGGGIIMGSVVFIAWREAVLERRLRAAEASIG